MKRLDLRREINEGTNLIMKYIGTGNNRYCNEKADTNPKPNKMRYQNK